MSIERFENALRQLQRETATQGSRAAVLAGIVELEGNGRIDPTTANSWRSVIEWLVGIDLNKEDVKSIFQELAADRKMRRAVSALGLKN
jgi:hypothetical protein